MRRIFHIFIVVVVVILLGIILLEATSRSCPKIKTTEFYPHKTCVEIVSTHTPNLQSKLLHEEMTIEEVLEQRTLYVSLEDLGANGTSCFAYGILINEDLPSRAKRYVATHEAIHFLGEPNETKANFRAAVREPFGLIQTIFYSLGLNLKILATKPLSSYPCNIGRLWIIFKVYFLGGSFERYVDTSF